MGCWPSLRLCWRRKPATARDVEVENTAPARPYHGSASILGDEKVPVPMGRIAQPAPIKVRTNVHPQYSAYSTPVDFKSQDELGYDARHFPAPRRPGTFDSLDTPVSTISPLTPNTPVYARAGKWKDEGVDDPDEERRRRKAEEAIRKAEQEEQERLDFFQML